ncbi:MAG TPA: Pr6Pr family membrane protein [Nocardioidaceae bacterium]|nr:Pr6Pr family membrane protein [Nocardioidaceae bacterium]
MGKARAWHLLTGLVAAFAVVFQLVLVWQGHAVLDEVDPPDLNTRLVRFISYFTILSNILVALTSLAIAAGKGNQRLWNVLRLDALIGIAVTGIVHWFFLRPLLDLHGNDYWADKLLHVIVPLLAVIGWSVFGPRGRVSRADLAPAAIFPGLYMAYTLIRGELVEWYPYPFTDVNEHGYGAVLANGVGVVVLFVVLALGAVWLDERLPGERD